MLIHSEMKELQRMSIEEIISTVGVILKSTEYGFIFKTVNGEKPDEPIQKIQRLLRRVSRDVTFTKTNMYQEVKKILIEYESLIDKENLVILSTYNNS